jgi:hypothetical protein
LAPGSVAIVNDWWGRPIAGSLPRLFLDHFNRTSLVARDHDIRWATRD